MDRSLTRKTNFEDLELLSDSSSSSSINVGGNLQLFYIVLILTMKIKKIF